MRQRIADVKNLRRLTVAYATVAASPPNIPKIILVSGKAGLGKTKAIAHMVNRTEGVALRALRTWTPSAMLQKCCRELEINAGPSCAAMVEATAESLKISLRPLFVDEANYIVKSERILETIRDIADLSEVPIILFGDERTTVGVKRSPQFCRRISQWVYFDVVDIEDARLVTDELCEVPVAEDLLERIYRETGGNIGDFTVALDRVESYTRQHGHAAATVETWGDAPFILRKVGH